MQLHKDALLFLNDHLGYGYVKEAVKRLKALGQICDTQMVRDVKRGKRNNLKVLKVLAEIASENKEAKEAVADLIQ